MKIEKEMSHPLHPHHKLKLQYTETPFNCDGCKEAGIGLKYKCHDHNHKCEFELHKACAVAPPVITHQFYTKCEFTLHYAPPGPARRRCDACRDEVTGLVYHCRRCGFDLHPCCANLPHALDDGRNSLYLCLKLSSACHHCGGRGAGWSYRSRCRGYNLHVACVKELLAESWEAVYLKVDKNKVRELHTRIPNLGRAGVRGGGNKVKKVAGGALRLIFSAVLGDPSAIITAVVGGLMSQ